jgi:porin
MQELFVRAMILFAALSVPDSATYAQDAQPSAAATQTAAAQPAPTLEPDFWHRETMTGDWSGTRSQWKEKGVELEFMLTQFAQGVASGGIHEGSVYNGKFQTVFEFDFGKLAGWNNWSAEVRTETRFGGPLLGGTGTISPVNTAVIIPAAAGTVFSITSLNITKLLPIDLSKGDLIAISAGRYNLVDLVDEPFFAGGGIERFFNIAQIGPLTVVREVPLITNAVNLAYIRGGEPFLTFSVLDPNDHSLNPGLSDLFTDGVTFSPGINFSAKYFGKTAKHSLGGAVTTKRYTPFSPISDLLIPGPPIHRVQPEGGSWSANYTFRQYIVERAKGNGWGFFGQVAIANQSTSPISRFANVGLGGNGLFQSRPKDEFGIAYAYTDLSNVLKDDLDPLAIRRLLPEHQVEMFYNFHITPWLRLTADLQVIRPTRPIAETAIIPGVRLELIL